jgi:hypothetical protein
MNQKPDILDEIINHLDPELIPTEYIILAKVRTYDGMETIVKREEYDQYMEDHSELVANVQVILDVRLIRQQILEITTDIFEKASQQ